MNLPTREQCEDYSPAQVAYLLCQNKMQECAITVKRLKIDGHRLLNLSESDLKRFHFIQQPQLQKMVQDIKKNDGSVIDKLRRLKRRPAPKVPARDYHDEDRDEQWSEAEFDSDTYEDPQEEQDDNYEPPPSHRVFTPTPSVTTFPTGEYLDSCNSRPNHPPRTPLRPLKTTKPLPPKPQHMDDDNDEDYINPESDEDNYITPTEKPAAEAHNHGRTRAVSSCSSTKPLPDRPDSPDLYEVPSFEENSPPVNRPSILRVPSQTVPPKASPRLHLRKPQPLPFAVQQPIEDDEYEVCVTEDDLRVKSNKTSICLPPKPMPRESNPLKPSPQPKPALSFRENEGSTLPRKNTNLTPTSASLPSQLKRPKNPLPQLFNFHKLVDRGNGPATDNGSKDTDEGADILKKPWYASTCDRKKAEDALIRSDKDGSFLVRQSSGQDPQQPFTLVVFYNGRVYNIPIRCIQPSKQYALGREKKGEERFSSVSQIIENHQRNSLVLIDSQSNSKDSTKLNYAVKP